MNKAILLLIITLFFWNSCDNSDKKIIIYKSEWKKVIPIKTERIELPEILNVIQLGNIGNKLLIQSENTDTLFYILNTKDLTKIAAYGIKSDGPDGFSNYPQIIFAGDSSKKNEFGVFDKQQITILSYDDGLHRKSNKESIGGYGIYYALFKLTDSIFCIQYADRSSFNIELANLYNYHTYDKISFPEENKDIAPFQNDGTICVYKDKIVYGRIYYDQIDIYKIIKSHTQLQHALTIKSPDASDKNIQKNVQERSYFYTNCICCDDKYIYLLNQEKLPNKKNNEQSSKIDIFDWNGKQVCRLELDIKATWGTLIDNNLFLRSKLDDDAIYCISLKDYSI